MNKYALSLALTAILTNTAQGVKMATRRELRKMNGKSSKSTIVPVPEVAPTCPQEEEPSSKSSKSTRGGRGNNGRGGKTGKGKGKSSVEEPQGPCTEDDIPLEVACGDTINTAVTLNEPLRCTTNIGLTLDGSEASLDCQGNGLFANPPSPMDNTPNTIGVFLRNGATMTNCLVSGFEFGTIVLEGDNSITDSSFFGNRIGIFLNGAGCDTIQNVNTSYNTEHGIRVAGNSVGQKIITGLTSNANQLDGFILTNSAGVGMAGVTVELENITTIQNGRFGIHITGDGVNAVNLYGSTVARSNGNAGFRVNSAGSTVTFKSLSTLDSSNNVMEGMEILSATSVILPNDFMATLCNNGGLDVTGGPLLDGTLGQGVTCGTEDVTTLMCVPGCPLVPTNACMVDTA